MNPTPPRPAPTRRIYLAGPMQGIPQFNFPRFHAVAKVLRLEGHSVFSPAEKDIERHGGEDLSLTNPTGSLSQAKAEHGFSLRQALAEDCEFICLEADTVCFLPGWEASKGAQAEHRLATALLSEKMEIIYFNELECQEIEKWGQVYADQLMAATEARNAA